METRGELHSPFIFKKTSIYLRDKKDLYLYKLWPHHGEHFQMKRNKYIFKNVPRLMNMLQANREMMTIKFKKKKKR